MVEQSRILLTLRYLLDHTDAGHEVSTRDIKAMLEQHGIPAPVSRTIDADIDLLVAAGYDIERNHVNGRPAFYRIVSRDFDTVELKVLIDAVAASRFINIEKSKQMISRLAAMACVGDRPYLESELAHVQTIKKAVGRAMYATDTLFRAIVARKKVQFQMVEYRAPDKALVPHRDGKAYVVSPYATIWANDRYYLLAHEGERDIIVTPRLDHIRKVKMLEEDAAPAPKGFDLGYYYSSSYKMNSGPEVDVTIECENSLIGKFIDRFGMDFECVPATDHSFRANVKACIGSTFFGWLLQYAGRMKPVAPEEAVTKYREQLSKALESL